MMVLCESTILLPVCCKWHQLSVTNWKLYTHCIPTTHSCYFILYLSSVKGCVLCLYTLCLGGKREDHLWLQAQGQILVVLLLCTVTWSLAVFVLRKKVRFFLHQELWGGRWVFGSRGTNYMQWHVLKLTCLYVVLKHLELQKTVEDHLLCDASSGNRNTIMAEMLIPIILERTSPSDCHCYAS